MQERHIIRYDGRGGKVNRIIRDMPVNAQVLAISLRPDGREHVNVGQIKKSGGKYRESIGLYTFRLYRPY